MKLNLSLFLLKRRMQFVKFSEVVRNEICCCVVAGHISSTAMCAAARGSTAHTYSQGGRTLDTPYRYGVVGREKPGNASNCRKITKICRES